MRLSLLEPQGRPNTPQPEQRTFAKPTLWTHSLTPTVPTPCLRKATFSGTRLSHFSLKLSAESSAPLQTEGALSDSDLSPSRESLDPAQGTPPWVNHRAQPRHRPLPPPRPGLRAAQLSPPLPGAQRADPGQCRAHSSRASPRTVGPLLRGPRPSPCTPRPSRTARHRALPVDPRVPPCSPGQLLRRPPALPWTSGPSRIARPSPRSVFGCAASGRTFPRPRR